MSEEKQQTENVLDFVSMKKKQDAKKREQKVKNDSKKARSGEHRKKPMTKEEKLKAAMATHGSDKGTAIRDRWKDKKIDVTKPEEKE